MSFLVAHALAASININPGVPGVSNASSSLGGFINGFYTFALAVSGILAFGAIVYGGIKYATGRGNPSAESEGKSWITSALLGLLLLAGAYVILFTINPNILNLQPPSLPGLATPTPTPAAAPQGTTQSNCAQTCYLPNTCVETTPNYWQCKSPSGGAPVAPGSGAGKCNPACTAPQVCQAYPNVIGITYSCVTPQPTSTTSGNGGTPICQVTNVPCPPPKQCVTLGLPGFPAGYQTCESAP